MTRATLTVASTVHTAIRLAPDHPDGRVVTVAGSRFGDLGEEAVTEGVDAEAFEAWLDRAPAEVKSRLRVVAESAPAGNGGEVSKDADDAEAAERAALTARANELGVKIDGRWRIDRLRSAVAQAEAEAEAKAQG